jgi:hypothetical protein
MRSPTPLCVRQLPRCRLSVCGPRARARAHCEAGEFVAIKQLKIRGMDEKAVTAFEVAAAPWHT